MTFLCNTTNNNTQTNNSNKNTHYGSLPNSGLINRAVEFDSSPNNNSINYPERSCLYTSFRGSITIEAAICFPLFMFVTLALVHIISIMYLQTTMQIALEEAARNASNTVHVGNSLLTTAYFYDEFLSEDMRNFLDNSFVENGSKGISFLSSSLDLTSGIADIVLRYTVTNPFLPKSLFSLNLSNRCYIHLFTGIDLAKEQTQATEYVYFTTSGSVFHFNRYCKYLINYSEAVRYLDVKGNLTSCTMCQMTIEELREKNPIVYIMPYGYCFHTTVKCSAFTGYVFRTTYTSLDADDKICEECMKGK